MTTAFLEKFNLDGQRALITGGAGLLGIRHGMALAACGAEIILADVHLENAQQAAGQINSAQGKDCASGIFLDVSKADSVQAAFEQTVSSKRGINILVNNAAIDPKVGGNTSPKESSRFENFPLEQWHFQIDVGLTGAFLCSQAFGSWMAKNGGGVILNIASDLSVIAPDQRLYHKQGLPEDEQPVKPVTYSVIKTALIGLTRYLAGYWANQNVRVNALSPGGVYTNQPEEFVTRLNQLIPMGRMATRDEYEAAVQFLCSAASRYMTGQNIVMDGGRSIL